MRRLTLGEALGGPWAAHWIIWVVLFFPATLMVMLREWVTPFPDWWAWVGVSAVAQHLAVGLVLIVGVSIARRRHTTIPVPTVLVMWTLTAVARATVAGYLASEVAGVDPQYLERVSSWVLSSLLWMPVVVYTFAQFDQRRLLLGAVDQATAQLSSIRAESARSAAAIQKQLLDAVRATLDPVLVDLRASLGAMRGTLEPHTVAEMSLRLSRLLDDTGTLIQSGLRPQDSNSTAPERASIRRAFDVEPARPWLVALLVTITTSGFIVPDVLIVFGPLAAIEVAVAVIAAGMVIGAVPAVARLGQPRERAMGQRSTAVGSVIGVVVATYVLLNSGIDPVTWHGLLVTPVLGTTLVAACAVFIAALVLSRHNSDAASQLRTLQGHVESEGARHRSAADRARRRLGELLHGPIQGRLAACVMALNFWAAGSSEDLRGQTISESVLDHLSAVSRDLLLLSTGATLKPPEVGQT